MPRNNSVIASMGYTFFYVLHNQFINLKNFISRNSEIPTILYGLILRTLAENFKFEFWTQLSPFFAVDM